MAKGSLTSDLESIAVIAVVGIGVYLIYQVYSAGKSVGDSVTSAENALINAGQNLDDALGLTPLSDSISNFFSSPAQ